MTLYCRPGSVECRDFREALEDLVIAHDMVWLEDPHEAPGLPPQAELPAMVDEGKVYSGSREVRSHLEDLEKFAADWRKYQCDACYYDDEGNIE